MSSLVYSHAWPHGFPFSLQQSSLLPGKPHPNPLWLPPLGIHSFPPLPTTVHFLHLTCLLGSSSPSWPQVVTKATASAWSSGSPTPNLRSVSFPFSVKPLSLAWLKSNIDHQYFLFNFCCLHSNPLFLSLCLFSLPYFFLFCKTPIFQQKPKLGEKFLHLIQSNSSRAFSAIITYAGFFFFWSNLLLFAICFSIFGSKLPQSSDHHTPIIPFLGCSTQIYRSSHPSFKLDGAGSVIPF